jgi:integrase
MTIEQYARQAEIDGLRPATIGWRTRALARIEQQTGPLDQATDEQIAAWWASTVRLKPGSRRTELCHLRAWARWAEDAGIIDRDPCRRLKPPRCPRAVPKPMSETAVALAVAEAVPRVRAWVILGAYAGLRAGEAAAWEPDHVQDGQLIIPEGKGGTERVVPAHPLVVDLERSWGHAESHNVSHSTRHWFLRRGIRTHHHAARHRYGTKLYQATGDLRLVQELMGHANIQTTAGYVAWNRDAARAAVDGL